MSSSFTCQLSIRTYIFLPSSISYQRFRSICFYYSEFSKNDTPKLITEIWKFGSILLIIINKIKLQFIYLLIIIFLIILFY